jgi:hypothetical protein
LTYGSGIYGENRNVQGGWELVSAVPLIAPNRDGIAYGTVGSQMILKRQKEVL